MPAETDEEQIRALVAIWTQATRAGDTDTVLGLMADGSPPVRRAGHTLTVFQKQQGRWLLARDANLLAPVPPTA